MIGDKGIGFATMKLTLNGYLCDQSYKRYKGQILRGQTMENCITRADKLLNKPKMIF